MEWKYILKLLFFILICCVLGMVILLGVLRKFYGFEIKSLQIIYRKYIKVLLASIAAVFVFSAEIVDIDTLKGIAGLVYAVLFLVSFFYLAWLFIVSVDEIKALNKFALILMTIIFLIAIGSSILAGLSSAIESGNEYIAFVVAIIFLAIYSCLLVEEFRLLTGTLSGRVPTLLRFVLGVFFIYIFLNAFVLLSFGMYNIEFNLANYPVEFETATIGQLMLAGGIFFFQFPTFDANQIGEISEFGRFVSIIQYFIGLFLNVLILPFFISYYSSLISQRNRTQSTESAEPSQSQNSDAGV